MNQSHNSSTPKIIGATVLSAILLIGAYIVLTHRSDATIAATPQATTTQSSEATTKASDTTASVSTAAADDTPTVTTQNPTSATYKDGTYTKTASYYVPHGTNSLTAKVSIKDGVISSVTTTNKYSDRESSFYIQGFNSSISGTVNGRSLDNAYVGRVGGASLTSSAFNDIIDAVIKDAKA